MSIRARNAILQVLLVAVVLTGSVYIIGVGAARLNALGLSSGFGFLGRPAGFDIGQNLIAYDHFSTYGRALVVAILNTLVVAAIGIVFSTILGFLIGIGQLSTNLLARHMAKFYVSLFRNIPLLLQIFFWYFAVLRSLPGVRDSMNLFDIAYINNRGIVLPRPIVSPEVWLTACAILMGTVAILGFVRIAGRPNWAPALFSPAMIILLGAATLFAVCLPSLGWETADLGGFSFHGGLQVMPEFAALLFGLTIYTSAFIAEIVRSGILSVSHGQHEAGRSLGLDQLQLLRLVVIPQALRVIIPPLTSQYLNLTKNTSLGSAIAYPELVAVFAGTVLNQTGQAVETIGITMGIYLALSLTIAGLMHWYERRVALVER